MKIIHEYSYIFQDDKVGQMGSVSPSYGFNDYVKIIDQQTSS